MTPWTIFLDIIPVLALVLAIVSLPLIADGPPVSKNNRHVPAKENSSAKTHMTMATAEVHFAKVR
jgi:hypothetical protein